MVLWDRAASVFSLAEAAEILHISADAASSLLRKATRRGLLSRLQGGKYMVIPPELGSTIEYAGNPLLVAAGLVGHADYFVSHASAMEIHRMVTQPQLVVYVSVCRQMRNRHSNGTEYRFVKIKPGHLFGTTKHWATKQEAVIVSDLERTVVDGLRMPGYCGGITEVAKGLWMRRKEISSTRLIDYAGRIGSGVVYRRLGYLLELYGLSNQQTLETLRRTLTATVSPLDPNLPVEGPHLSAWRIQLNVSPDELMAVRGT
jgi:predicted transcriptional regulator of viral defense system